MAISKRVARRPKARTAASKASSALLKRMGKLYAEHHKAYFEEVRVGLEKDNDGKYAGFRCWADGYRAGVLAGKARK